MTTHSPELLSILHEHPTWFLPLFAELNERGIAHETFGAEALVLPLEDGELGDASPRFLFNRMSPSAFLRSGASAVRFTLHYLEALEAKGVRVINGARAYRTEISKLEQVRIIRGLGLTAPRTVAAHDAEGVRRGVERLGYPAILKPNVGGSGAGVLKVTDPEGVESALRVLLADPAGLAVDPTLLVQEFVPPRGGSIVRVEVVGGRFLYAIRIHLTGESFNLCPADVCQGVDGVELSRTACPVDTPKNGLRVERYDPHARVIAEVEAIMADSGVEVGGVEYLVDDRSGGRVYYDVNALSNFVADPVRVLGFDPFARLVDWLEGEIAVLAPPGEEGEEARRAGEIEAAVLGGVA